jgi:hypothetical protein
MLILQRLSPTGVYVNCLPALELLPTGKAIVAKFFPFEKT